MVTFRKRQNPRQSARERSGSGKSCGNIMLIVTMSHDVSRICHDKSRQIKIQIKIQIQIQIQN
ncbi:hypothetical protein D4635_26275 [Escherichia coli]|nr:hypothetical protein [Escherichia coli]EEX0438809.1 hypothetical protein [Escherichia coli]EGD9425015.1 hypothetical protein [Escherichia coli]